MDPDIDNGLPHEETNLGNNEKKKKPLRCRQCGARASPLKTETTGKEKQPLSNSLTEGTSTYSTLNEKKKRAGDEDPSTENVPSCGRVKHGGNPIQRGICVNTGRGPDDVLARLITTGSACSEVQSGEKGGELKRPVSVET